MAQILFSEALLNIFQEITMTRRSPGEKRKIKKRKRIAHRGTNWSSLGGGKPKRGFKRVKVGEKRYQFERMSPEEKVKKKQVGTQLGKAKNLRKK